MAPRGRNLPIQRHESPMSPPGGHLLSPPVATHLVGGSIQPGEGSTPYRLGGWSNLPSVPGGESTHLPGGTARLAAGVPHPEDGSTHLVGWSTSPLRSRKCGTVTCRARWRGAFPISDTVRPEQGEVRLLSGATQGDHTTHHLPRGLSGEASETGRGRLVTGRMDEGAGCLPTSPPRVDFSHQARKACLSPSLCLCKSYLFYAAPQKQ